MSKEIRRGQLIVPFGPGSLYTDRDGTTLVICGLDHWFKREPGIGLDDDIRTDEFDIFEPRLLELLKVGGLRRPPDYRSLRMGQTPPPNAGLTIPALRFPRWYRNTTSGRLHRFNLHTLKPTVGGELGYWKPVRFVAVCEHGHLSEFPWKVWAGCTCNNTDKLFLNDRGGADLSSIRVECRNCKNGRSLSGTTVKPQEGKTSRFGEEGISCDGDRPWLGEGAEEGGCGAALVGALINQTNLYFPRTMSAINLPNLEIEDENVVTVRNRLEQDQSLMTQALTFWRAGQQEVVVAMVTRVIGGGYEPDVVRSAMESLFDTNAGADAVDEGPLDLEGELQSFRRAEFNIMRNEVDDVDRSPNLRVVSTVVPRALNQWVERVNLVERLRETRAFYGFDRMEPNPAPLADMPDSAMQQLFRTPPDNGDEYWLPAIEVFGEGIYIELQEEAIMSWQNTQSTWLASRLADDFLNRLQEAHGVMAPLNAVNRSWASRIHT